MTARQPLDVTVAFDAIASEYTPLVQIAGLGAGIVGVCQNDASTPEQFRKLLVRQIQRTLPANLPASVRADATCMPDESFTRTETLVREAVIEQAHQSPVLRPVVTHDKTGREITEFFGDKRSWMGRYAATPLIMKRCGDASF